MKILKILNNNVVIAKDEKDREIIVMKKGLGFSKKAGDNFSKEEDQKIFILSDKVRDDYLELIKSIRPLATELAEKTIDYAVNVKQLDVTDMVHLTLADHLDGMLDRLEKGLTMTNQLTAEIGRVYPTEFDIGLYGKNLLEKEAGYVILTDEAAFIALHFITGRKKDSTEREDVDVTVNFVRDITRIVEKYFNKVLDEESISYIRFVRHLKFLVKRIYADNEYDDDIVLYDNVSVSYPEAADCVNRIARAIELKYKKQVSMEEKAYLTIYVEKLIREKGKKE
ncbi:MAG: PRD domain-containing protein [Lachnospiraceae bacterium]|nr:PRD domain-containing protein [Lachnospiraceae bacterium]